MKIFTALSILVFSFSASANFCSGLIRSVTTIGGKEASIAKKDLKRFHARLKSESKREKIFRASLDLNSLAFNQILKVDELSSVSSLIPINLIKNVKVEAYCTRKDIENSARSMNRLNDVADEIYSDYLKSLESQGRTPILKSEDVTLGNIDILEVVGKVIFSPVKSLENLIYFMNFSEKGVTLPLNTIEDITLRTTYENVLIENGQRNSKTFRISEIEYKSLGDLVLNTAKSDDLASSSLGRKREELKGFAASLKKDPVVDTFFKRVLVLPEIQDQVEIPLKVGKFVIDRKAKKINTEGEKVFFEVQELK